MTRPPLKKLFLAAVGGFFSAGLALYVLYAAGTLGLAGTSLLSGLGWIVPTVAALVTGAVAVMLTRVVGDEDRDTSQASIPSICPMCGGAVRDDWRLCPHCGERLAAA